MGCLSAHLAVAMNVHLKAKGWHPALHFRLQWRLPLAWVYCFSKIWCSRERFIFLCKKHAFLFRWKKTGGPFGLANKFYSKPYELRFHSCILHQRVWSHASWLPSEDPLVQSSILAFYSEPHELICRSCILHQRVWIHASWLPSEDPLVQSSILQCVLHRQVRTLLTGKCGLCYFPDWFFCQTCISYYCCFFVVCILFCVGKKKKE